MSSNIKLTYNQRSFDILDFKQYLVIFIRIYIYLIYNEDIDT